MYVILSYSDRCQIIWKIVKICIRNNFKRNKRCNFKPCWELLIKQTLCQHIHRRLIGSSLYCTRYAKQFKLYTTFNNWHYPNVIYECVSDILIYFKKRLVSIYQFRTGNYTQIQHKRRFFTPFLFWTMRFIYHFRSVYLF